MSYRILMVSSVPLAHPWNGADKNFARLLASFDDENCYTLQTGLKDPWPGHITPIRLADPNPMPTMVQKGRTFAYLLRYTRRGDLVHIISSLSHPSRGSLALLKTWRAAAGRPVIHTLPSIGDLPLTKAFFTGDWTVVVSEHTRSRLSALGVPNVVRVYPPLDQQKLAPAVAPEAVAQELALGNQAILYPGHYGAYSGIPEVIQAFAGLAGHFRQAVLVLACRVQPNQDATREAQQARALALRAGIADRVRIVGNVADMPALISACALTVLTPAKLASKMDLPMVVLESLALKRPVIVSQQPPMDEALFGQAGFAIPPGQIGDLSAAIGRLLEDPDLRWKLGEQGQRAVFEHCHPNRVVAQYRDIYQAVMARGNSLVGKLT